MVKVGYVINQYPMPSHTFIRNEIRELERQGLAVERYSVRGWDAMIVDPLDKEERSKTRFLLQGGLVPLAIAAADEALRSPARFLATLGSALKMSRGSNRSVFKHIAYLLEACLLLRWARAAGVTHFHAHFGTNAADVALHAHELSGLTYSCTIHGSNEFDYPMQLKLREKVRKASFVATVSSFCRSQVYRWAELRDWPKIEIIHCGLDESFLGSTPVHPPRRRRLVCVGRLCEQKGQLLLLEMLSILRKRGTDVELVLAGEGEMRLEIEQMISERRLGDRVTITGVLDAEQVRSAINASDALVLASFAEGLPVVIMEAMALGRPIISTLIAGIPELVRDGEEGFLVPAGDREALADAVARLLSLEPDALARMGERCRTRVRERHSISIEAGKLMRLFSASVQPSYEERVSASSPASERRVLTQSEGAPRRASDR